MFKTTFPKTVKDLQFLEWAEPQQLQKKTAKRMKLDVKLQWKEYPNEDILPVHYGAARAKAIGLEWMFKLPDQPHNHVNIKTTNGVTPIMFAAMFGNTDTILVLLNANAVINAQDKDGNTALHYACKNSKFSCVEKLVKVYADTKLRNKEGKTARDIARDENKLEILHLLENTEDQTNMVKFVKSMIEYREDTSKKFDELNETTKRNCEQIAELQEQVSNISEMSNQEKVLAWRTDRSIDSGNTLDSGRGNTLESGRNTPDMHARYSRNCEETKYVRQHYDLLREYMLHADDIVAKLYASNFMNDQLKNEIRNEKSKIAKNELVLNHIIHGSREMFYDFFHSMEVHYQGQQHLVDILRGIVDPKFSPTASYFSSKLDFKYDRVNDLHSQCFEDKLITETGKLSQIATNRQGISCKQMEECNSYANNGESISNMDNIVTVPFGPVNQFQKDIGMYKQKQKHQISQIRNDERNPSSCINFENVRGYNHPLHSINRENETYKYTDQRKEDRINNVCRTRDDTQRLNACLEGQRLNTCLEGPKDSYESKHTEQKRDHYASSNEILLDRRRNKAQHISKNVTHFDSEKGNVVQQNQYVQNSVNSTVITHGLNPILLKPGDPVYTKNQKQPPPLKPKPKVKPIVKRHVNQQNQNDDYCTTVTTPNLINDQMYTANGFRQRGKSTYDSRSKTPHTGLVKGRISHFSVHEEVHKTK